MTSVSQPMEPVTWGRTSDVLALCHPFEGVCWFDLQLPLTLTDVDLVLERGEERLHPPLPTPAGQPRADQTVARRVHAEKIAWFARHGFQRPIDVDVGVPALGCRPRWAVQDGNHRLAAAAYRMARLNEDPWLPLTVSGSLQYARELRLMQRRPRIHQAA